MAGMAGMAPQLSAWSPGVGPRAPDGGPSLHRSGNRWFHYEPFSSSLQHTLYLSLSLCTKMEFDWMEKAVLFYASPCCSLTDRLRVTSGRPGACVVLRLLLFQTSTGKYMT